MRTGWRLPKEGKYFRWMNRDELQNHELVETNVFLINEYGGRFPVGVWEPVRHYYLYLKIEHHFPNLGRRTLWDV